METHSVKKERYQWALEGNVDRNYALIAAYEDRAGTVAIGTNNVKVGANKSMFYMDFDENPFQVTEVIEGMLPDTYKVRINSAPWRVGAYWRYEVQLITASSAEFIPATELAASTRWSSAYGLVTDTLSDEGFDISFQSPSMLHAEMSMFRMQHTVPGNMIRTGKVYPLKFHFVGEDGSTRTSWISNVEWEFLKKAKYARASLIMNGKSNRWADGTYGNIDKNGFTVKAGSGFRETMVKF